MRWIQAAKRALEETFDYVREREAFGDALADHEECNGCWAKRRCRSKSAACRPRSGGQARSWGFRLQGSFHGQGGSVGDPAQSQTPRFSYASVRGYSKDTPLEWMYHYARRARLVDGSSETHKMVLSRHLLAEGIDFWSWD